MYINLQFYFCSVLVIDSEVIVIAIVSNWDSNKEKCFQPERCKLTGSIFEKLMNIKCNGHLV